jgi:hypothetical protein
MASTNVKLGAAAVTLELGAVALVLTSSRELHVLSEYFLMHALACACMTPLAWSLMPANYQQPRRWVLLLLYSLCFFIPLLGLFGFAIGAMAAAWLPRLPKREDFDAVATPHYELPKTTPVSGWRSGRVRQQIADASAPLELRMKALLALQDVPTRQSSGILREALADSTDDLRLLAYGMLDAREQHLTHRIEHALQRHQTAGQDDEARYLAARELAELYWELVYQELVQGDMRSYALAQVKPLLQRSAGVEGQGHRTLGHFRTHAAADRRLQRRHRIVRHRHPPGLPEGARRTLSGGAGLPAR